MLLFPFSLSSRPAPRPRLPRISIVHPDSSMVRLVREMFIYHRYAVMFEQVPSAELARRRLAPTTARPAPRLIMIGLGLHHQCGLELLRFLRSDHRLSTIPVIVLSQAHREADERRALAIGADFYLEVPSGIEGFSNLVVRTRELLALGDERDEARTPADAG